MQNILFYFSKNNTELFNLYSGDYAACAERYQQATDAIQRRQGTRQGGLNR
jgi:hypothetical protein